MALRVHWHIRCAALDSVVRKGIELHVLSKPLSLLTGCTQTKSNVENSSICFGLCPYRSDCWSRCTDAKLIICVGSRSDHVRFQLALYIYLFEQDVTQQSFPLPERSMHSKVQLYLCYSLKQRVLNFALPGSCITSVFQYIADFAYVWRDLLCGMSIYVKHWKFVSTPYLSENEGSHTSPLTQRRTWRFRTLCWFVT